MKKLFYTLLWIVGFVFVIGFLVDVLDDENAPQNAPQIVPPGANIFVNDTANLLSSDTEKYITKINDALAPTGAQVVVVTIKSLNGASLEDYATALFNSYGIGDKAKNNGVLFLLALDDRASRIEVGLGLEGALSDAKTGRIQDKYMIPHFRADSWDEGILGGFNAVVSEIAAEYGVSLKGLEGGLGGNFSGNLEQNATTKNAEQNATGTYGDDEITKLVKKYYWFIIVFLVLVKLGFALLFRRLRIGKITELNAEIDKRDAIIAEWIKNGKKGKLPKWESIKEPGGCVLCKAVFYVLFFAFFMVGMLNEDDVFNFFLMVANLIAIMYILPWPKGRKYNDNGTVYRSSRGGGEQLSVVFGLRYGKSKWRAH